MLNRSIQYPRGGIFWVDMNFQETARGVQTSNRPCVIVSNNDGNVTNSTVMVALITSKDKAGKGINVPFINNMGQQNVVLCNQVHTVSKNWLSDKKMGMLSDDVMKNIDDALALALSINRVSVNVDDIEKLMNRYIERKMEIAKINAETQAEKLAELITEKIHNKLEADTDTIISNSISDTISKVAEKTIEKEVSKISSSKCSNSGEKVSRKGRKAKKQELLNEVLKDIKTDNTEKQEEVEKKAPKTRKKHVNTAKASEKQAVKEVKETKKQTKNTGKQGIRERGFWTDEKKLEFVVDKENMSLEQLQEKWNMTNTKSIKTLYYMYKKQLQL